MSCRTTTFICIILLLGACSQSENQPAPKLFKDQRDVLDKAKTVDPALQNQDEEQRKSIEKQTQ